jgi:hypothetical protein
MQAEGRSESPLWALLVCFVRRQNIFVLTSCAVETIYPSIKASSPTSISVIASHKGLFKLA